MKLLITLLSVFQHIQLTKHNWIKKRHPILIAVLLIVKCLPLEVGPRRPMKFSKKQRFLPFHAAPAAPSYVMGAKSSTAFTISSSQTKQKQTQYVPLAKHHTIIICQNLSSNHNLGLAQILKDYNNRVDIWSELSFWFVKIHDAVHAI